MRPLRDVAEESGLSYRQGNYYAREGWVRVTWLDSEGNEVDEGGTGYRAMLDPLAQQHLAWMAGLVRAGFEPSRAAEVATLLAAGASSIGLAENLVLMRGPLIGEPDAVLQPMR